MNFHAKNAKKVENIQKRYSQVVGDYSRTLVKNRADIEAGKELNIKAGEYLRIHVGASSIEMHKNGEVLINGAKLKVNFNDLLKLLSDLVEIN